MMEPTLSDLEFLARRAGEILRQGYNPRPSSGPRLQVSHKSEIDLVTEFDRRSEGFLIQEIQRRFPGHEIITEESGLLEGVSDKRWYIDPLDGTVNYAHSVPLFAVSVAYAAAGRVELGVVYDPIQAECFSAERGRGAWLNGEPIRVAAAKDLNRALLVTGFPYDIRTNPENNLDHYARLSLVSQGVRRLGSAAIDLAYIAAGRFDGFWEIRIHSWDIAAGGLIVEEAGGIVTNITGHPDYLTPPQSVLAANTHLHPQLLRLLNPA
jgi:myo-inositol-1(or 4)-monophosphatase